MSFEFLSPDLARGAGGVAAPLARSPIEALALAAGARMEARDGWSVAADYGAVDEELAACRDRVGIADRSQLGKLELQGPAQALRELCLGVRGAVLARGRATEAGGAWWCPVTPTRVLALVEPGATAALREALQDAAGEGPCSVLELTTGLAALAVVGPAAAELLARLTALDLRAARVPVGAFAPGSVARVPAMVLREADDRFLVTFGSAQAHYMWTVVADAGQSLGARQVGAAALERLLPAPRDDGVIQRA